MKERRMDDKTALGFNTICNFIRDLNASFGGKQKSLMLYGHLIEKTGLIHIEPVKKHIRIFQKFITDNETAILERDKKKMVQARLVYSDKVAIDLGQIFRVCDREEEGVIWTHLLTIAAVIVPESQAKRVLQEMKTKKTTTGGAAAANGMEDMMKGIPGMEGDFLKDFMGKIGSQLQDVDESNPMAMITSLMSSGVFTELFSSMSGGMKDGNLDIGKMMSSMQGLMSNIGNMVDTNDGSPVTTTPLVSAASSSPTLPPPEENLLDPID